MLYLILRTLFFQGPLFFLPPSIVLFLHRQLCIPGCIVDGPLALDNVVSMEAARHKGIVSPVAGQADIILTPDVESGNTLAKSYIYLAGGRAVGVVIGARAPVVLTSRADSAEAKFLSIATAVLMIDIQRTYRVKMGKIRY